MATQIMPLLLPFFFNVAIFRICYSFIQINLKEEFSDIIACLYSYCRYLSISILNATIRIFKLFETSCIFCFGVVPTLLVEFSE